MATSIVDAWPRDKCWFCERNVPNAKDTIKVDVSRQLSRQPGFGGIKYTFESFDYSVPRCTLCRTAQRKAKTLEQRVTVLSLVPLVSLCLLFTLLQSDIGLMGAGIVGVVILVLSHRYRNGLAERHLREQGIKQEIAWVEYPAIQSLREQGWMVFPKK